MKLQETIINIKNITHPQAYFNETTHTLELFVWQKDGMYRRLYSCTGNKIRLQLKQYVGQYTYAKRINTTYIIVCRYQSVNIISCPFS